MVRVALYTRVSTEDQAKEGFSLDAQMERLRFFAKAQGWEVGGEYVDEGHSGRTIKRPKYTQMMEERARWDTLLVLKMDRIHRNSRNFMAMMDQLRKEGKEFASVTESLDTSTAMGRFVMDIIQRIAQLESEQIGERVYVGMSQKARTSRENMGRAAPYGYAYGGTSPSGMQVVPEERPVVEELFRRVQAGEPRGTVAADFTARGLTTRQGKPWTIWNVTAILTNPIYAGAGHWEGALQYDAHEAIVRPTDFDHVQALVGQGYGRKQSYRLTQLSPDAQTGTAAANLGRKAPPLRGR